MKIAMAILAVGLIVLGILFINYKQTATQQIVEANQKVEHITQQLTFASNDLVRLQTVFAAVTTQMEARVEQVHHQLAEAIDEKNKAQLQAQELSADLDVVKRDLEKEQGKVADLQKKNEVLGADVQSVNQQLASVEQKLADLEKRHATTVDHLTAMREEYVALTKEKTSLEAKLHDLHALNAQIAEVKHEIHQRKVEESERIDRAETVLGNGGFIMKSGAWITPQVSGKYPLTEEIHREP